MSDNVKHPSHYTEGRKYEPKDVIRDWGLNFNIGSAVKYLSRAGRKDDIVQDLRKAQEVIQFEIDAIEQDRVKASKHNPVRVTDEPTIKELTKEELLAELIEEGLPAELVNLIVNGICSKED